MISATRLFVGNLPENTKENDLHSAFSVFGEITNLDLKSKSGEQNKKFAFVSISAPNANVESCIKHFSIEDFNGNRLYVTRARESFLERLQRERDLAQKKDAEKKEYDSVHKKNPVIKLGDKLNPRKRKIDHSHTMDLKNKSKKKVREEAVSEPEGNVTGDTRDSKNLSNVTDADKRKHEAEKKRLESIKKKRQEFNEKKSIIKTGLTGVDKAQNKKIIFSDVEEDSPKQNKKHLKNRNIKENQSSLFDDNAEDSDDGLNFEIKKQFEGKKGQKVLDLQSRYKSDKRFTLDERFVDDEEDEENDGSKNQNEEVELGTADEKTKQMNILQDVLGVTIKQKFNLSELDSKKNKPKMGMLRFDPLHPDHAKFLAPIESKPEPLKKSKKKAKEKQEDIKEVQVEPEGPKVEVSKEQFYKVSETLKEAIEQPSSFSLRSLFGNNDDVDEGPQAQETDYILLEAPKQKKVKNPFDPKEKNPFVYDSSESETEEPDAQERKAEVLPTTAPATEIKAVWKENLFFSKNDRRLKEGLEFFSKPPDTEVQKERRELKSLMKKRIYNKDRKNQMFKKKIGGRKKLMKKSFKTKT